MKWVALATLVACSVVRLPSPLVRTAGGLLRGRLEPRARYYQYFGIPYGTVDDTNRFQAPLPPPTWEGVYDAIEENTWCPQRLHETEVIVGHPNCLKLNVYAPTSPGSGALVPVMVFVHGGCFFEGVGSRYLYGGDYFAEHGVVFVGINYRLNVEGFLCLGIKEAPGNAGLKDQIAALKWVKHNIKAFGGDPDNVTLFGESAGAVSISYLTISPAANGLFHKVILQSGSTIVPWGIQHDPIEAASSLVKELGYNTKDPHEIFKILSKIHFADILRAVKIIERRKWITGDNLFVPCIENELADVEPIVTEFPLDIISRGNYTKVPMMVGYNDMEGYFFVAKDFGRSLREADVADLLKRDLIFPSEIEKNETVEEIRDHYFSSDKDELIMSMVNLYSDLHFKFPTVVESEMYARTTEQPIFYYVFKYSGYMNFPKLISLFRGPGASHADELFYMLKSHIIPAPHRWLERTMTKRLVTMWTNFAKYSEPTPETSDLLPIKWNPSREWNPKALVIDYDVTTAPMWDLPSVRLWNDTYNKYRRKDYGFRLVKEISRNSKSKCCDLNSMYEVACNDTGNINSLGPL